MTALIIIGVYLVGYILAYFSLKDIMGADEGWSVGDRIMGLLMALFSWLAVVVFLFWFLMTKILPDTDKPAKW